MDRLYALLITLEGKSVTGERIEMCMAPSLEVAYAIAEQNLLEDLASHKVEDYNKIPLTLKMWKIQDVSEFGLVELGPQPVMPPVQIRRKSEKNRLMELVIKTRDKTLLKKVSILFTADEIKLCKLMMSEYGKDKKV